MPTIDIKTWDNKKVGSIDLHSTKQAYLGVNYKF